MNFPFTLPFIRWANQAWFPAGSGMTGSGMTGSGMTGMRPRRLYDHELVYVLAGRGEIIIEGQVFPAQADYLFLIAPRVWHFFRAAHDERLTLLGVHFDWVAQDDTYAFAEFRAADEPVEESRFRQPRAVPGWDWQLRPFLDLKGRPRVRRLLADVVAEYARGDEMAPSGAGALLAAALTNIAREAALLEKQGTLSHIGPDALRRVERARALLEAPRETPLAIEEVARQVGWSADHLRRMFRAVLGASPHKIQTAARIRRAKELLRYEHVPISKIAEQCGFEDASHLARVFKQECGLSPRQFLALMRN